MQNQLAEYENKILSEIPILSAMQVRIVKFAGNRSVISVPLKPNHNHKGTVFGGSLYSSCTAAAYTLLYGLQVQANCHDRDIVIAKGEMKYLKPVEKDFLTIAEVQNEDWQKLIDSFNKNKPHRIPLKAFIRLSENGEDLCQFNGEFAFIRSNPLSNK